VGQKILNSPARFVDDVVRGALAAFGDEVEQLGEARTLLRRGRERDGRVAVVSGGGTGHWPLFAGYVGEGMLDGVAMGNVFASPSVDQIVDLVRALDRGAGVLGLYANYTGDRLNFELAKETLDDEGVTLVLASCMDDVLSAPRERREARRGIAGIVLLYKIAGAMARAGASADEIAQAVARHGLRLGSVGFALSACSLPGRTEPTFELGPTEMELGMGIHGEPGVRRQPLASAREIARECVALSADDIGLEAGERVVVAVNGLGSTSREELFILFGDVADALAERGVHVADVWLGELATSFEMAGGSVSLLVVDDATLALLKSPARGVGMCLR
jgi:dihydroxyacetone kinase-like protein